MQLLAEAFIKKASKLWRNKFDYSLVNYQGSKTKVVFICPKHGKFKQTPFSHLQGRDCSQCSRPNQNKWNQGNPRFTPTKKPC